MILKCMSLTVRSLILEYTNTLKIFTGNKYKIIFYFFPPSFDTILFVRAKVVFKY